MDIWINWPTHLLLVMTHGYRLMAYECGDMETIWSMGGMTHVRSATRHGKMDQASDIVPVASASRPCRAKSLFNFNTLGPTRKTLKGTPCMASGIVPVTSVSRPCRANSHFHFSTLDPTRKTLGGTPCMTSGLIQAATACRVCRAKSLTTYPIPTLLAMRATTE